MRGKIRDGFKWLVGKVDQRTFNPKHSKRMQTNYKIMDYRRQYLGSSRSDADKVRFKARMVYLGFSEWYVGKLLEELDKEEETYGR